MGNRRSDLQVGLFAVIGLLLLAMMTLIFGGFKNVLSRTYMVKASFANAGGTTQGTPVRLLGIDVGRVKKITLSDDKAGVVMTMEINSDVDISADSALYIKQEGFIANIYLEFGAGSATAALPKDGSAMVEGSIETFAFYLERATKTLAGMSADVNAKVSEVGNKLIVLAENLNELTGDAQFRTDIKALTSNASTVAGQLKERLPDLMDNLTTAAGAAQESMEKASALFEEYQSLGVEMKDTTALVKEQVARQGGNLDELTASLGEAADNVAKLASSLNDVAVAVKSGQGTVGKMMTDPELYISAVGLVDKLSVAAEEFRDLAATIKKHPDWVIKGPPKERR